MQIHYVNVKYPHSDQQPMLQVGIVPRAKDKPLSEKILTCIESFNRDVGCKSVPDLTHANGCDLLFDEVDSNTVHIAFPSETSDQIVGSLSVSVLNASDYSALPSILHTILAPAFVPGFVPGVIGVDWGDVVIVLRSGAQAFLALVMGETEVAINHAFMLLNSRLKHTQSKVVVKGALAVLFSPMGKYTLTQVNQTFQQVRGLVPEGQPLLVGTPHVTDGNPIFALLVVTDSPC